jgi:hypothetical protein
MAADEVNMNWETIRWILTEKLGMRKICAQESHRATAGCALERSFLHPDALR